MLLAGAVPQAIAQYPGWQHEGSFYMLTTPDGANLPATASEDGFPILVRLDKRHFDFSQARADGADIRFSAAGKPLAYEVDEWDAAKGIASIWVRIPNVKGNAQQEIKLHWGKPDASGESNGSAVFNESNGYVSVLHMGETGADIPPATPVKSAWGGVVGAVRQPMCDSVGVLRPLNLGTTAATGVIGPARHFAGHQAILCGENLTNMPAGGDGHTSEAWIRVDRPNGTVLAWGNDGPPGGKLVMQFRSPPHVNVHSMSTEDVNSKGPLAMGEWIHVAYAYGNGRAELYINGRLDASGAPKLDLKNPAVTGFGIGGWEGPPWFSYVGDIDEVRISKATRSANWVRLQYENQKPMQTLVGPLVQAGSGFAVSVKKLDLLEGARATVTADAGGARKMYWIIKRGDQETIAATDQLDFVMDAGRVARDEALVLRFKAVYADAVKMLDVPVTIREDIPDPVFTLQAPAEWDGRSAIEVVPQVSNMKELEAKGAGKLNCAWSVADIAVIKEAVEGKLLLKRAQNSGTMTVTAVLDNGGGRVTRSVRIAVKEPARDPWVQRIPDKDEKPQDNQFYARDDTNEGTLYCNGTLTEAAEAVFLKLYADDKLIKTERRPPGADMSYAFAVRLKAGLVKYRVEFGTMNGPNEKILHTATNIVCGDAYVIQGQSNAEAGDMGRAVNPYTSDWVRSFGMRNDRGPKPIWGNAVSYKYQEVPSAKDTGIDTELRIGYWGIELAKQLVENHKIPVCFINGAVGGTRIDEHQRNPANPTDPATIYGRLLQRVRDARLTHGIRGILWHQGESDQGADGPTGRYGWETYQQDFIDLAAAWKQDFPNIQHYYMFQIWPRSCAMGRDGSDNRLREAQRTLPRAFSNLAIMSTLGIEPPGDCHFPPAGYAEFARLIGPLVERDNYGKVFHESITPPDLVRAAYANASQDTIVLEFDQPVIWLKELVSEFYLDGEKGRIASGSVEGRVVTLKLTAPSSARTITYLDSKAWSQKNILRGSNGIAALTFCEVPISRSVGILPTGQ